MKRFCVKRLSKRQGSDWVDHGFGICAQSQSSGSGDLNKGTVVKVLLAETDSRLKAQQLADALQAAYDNWHKDQLGVKSPLFLAAQAAYHLLTTLPGVKPVSIPEHGKVVDDLSAALNEVDPTGSAILTGV